MARTHVQQSQISGSLSADISDSLGTGSALEGQGTLVGDLNALRSQINKIIGGTKWYDALSGSQNLADIEAAMHVAGLNADFQGTLDVTGAMDVAGQVDLAAVGVATNVRGTLDVTEAATFNGNVTLGSDGSDSITFSAVAASNLDMDSNKVVGLGQADTDGDALAWNMAAQVGSLTVTGTMAKVNNGADPVGHLYLVGASNEVSASSKMFFDGSLFTLSGSADISGSLSVGNGLTVVDGGLTVAGDSMEITGSFTVVSGPTVLSGSVSIEGDIAQRLYIVAADGSIKDEAKLTFDDSELLVTGSAKLTSNLTVEGGLVTLSDGVTMESTAANYLVLTASDAVEVTGDLQVNGDILADADESKAIFAAVGAGHDITLGGAGSRVVAAGDLKVGGDTIVASDNADSIELLGGGDVKVYGELQVYGNIINDSANSKVMEFKTVSGVGDSVEIANNLEVKKDLFAVSGSFTGDVTVGGDLKVAGKMTWIDTENLKIKDSLIHLNATGSSTMPRGIVFHGDNAAYDDLAFGAAGNSGDFVFAKKVNDADVDIGNGEIFSLADLAAAKMSSVMLGGAADGISGSLSYSAGNIELSADNDLLLAGNSENAISFIEPGEWSTFSGSFGGSSSIVGALNSLASAAASSAAKAVYYSTDFAGDVLDFSALGVVPSGDHKYVDVYLNGVLLSQGLDVVSVATGSVTLESGIVSGLTGDDVITVTLRNAS
ncbi:MAG: hypothetical protein EBS48_06045 [Actinobacteria bacterium]|nr:hypothetical protein [Actinomycetota bacterium]